MFEFLGESQDISIVDMREPHRQLELTRSVAQLTSLHYAEYTVMAFKNEYDQ